MDTKTKARDPLAYPAPKSRPRPAGAARKVLSFDWVDTRPAIKVVEITARPTAKTAPIAREIRAVPAPVIQMQRHFFAELGNENTRVKPREPLAYPAPKSRPRPAGAARKVLSFDWIETRPVPKAVAPVSEVVAERSVVEEQVENIFPGDMVPSDTECLTPEVGADAVIAEASFFDQAASVAAAADESGFGRQETPTIEVTQMHPLRPGNADSHSVLTTFLACTIRRSRLR